MNLRVQEEIDRIARDRTSGASDLVGAAGTLLKEVLANGNSMEEVARRLLKAQPSMAPLWNLVGEALAATDQPELFDRYLQQIARGPRIIARHAAGLFPPAPGAASLELVTVSYSSTVLAALESIAAHQQVTIACTEGRPALEGRRMAEHLAARGIPVIVFGDAAIGQALDRADSVLVGADAVTPSTFLNKAGTRMLAAAAAQQGLPFYVCATRDKFVSTAVASRLVIRDESPDEIWPSPPPGITVRNQYFEATPIDLVTAVISDVGVLGAALVPDACQTPHDHLLMRL